jgi:putative ABC transport system substrate-binding protein
MITMRLELLRELVPGLDLLAVIVRDDPGLEQKLQDIGNNAKRMGIKVWSFEATTGTALEFAFKRLRSERCQAVYVASGPLGPAKRATIISLAAEAHLPVIYCFRVFGLDGGLMTFGADYGDLFRRAAGYVDKILKGAKPADLPIQPPTKFELVVNLKAAKALGLTIPQSILVRADQVIA